VSSVDGVSSVVTGPETGGVPPAHGFAGVVARLTGLNVLLVIAAMLTGPILARALGPEGRGELSAILAILVLAPMVLDFGLADFVARERARGTHRGKVLGTAMPIAICFSLLGVLFALPLAELIGQQRPIVERWVRISLFATPVLVFSLMLLGLARGEQRWSILYRWRLINAVMGTILIVGLAVLGRLTVQSAVVATLVTIFLALLMSLPAISGPGRWRFDRQLALPALAFGGRSWLIALSAVANYRLDQVLMAAVVSSEELGYYAVAVSVSAIASGFVGSVSTALLPRVAQEGVHAVPRIVRVAVLVIASSMVLVAASAPVSIPLVFGDDFRPAVLLLAILSVGAIFLGVSSILGSALQGHGRPQDTVRPQLLGLAVTLVGLAIALGPWGALGAAVVSVIAYACVLLGTLFAAVREFQASPRTLLLPRLEDLRWLVEAVRRRWRVRGRDRRGPPPLREPS